MKKIRVTIGLLLICSLVAIIAGAAMLRLNWKESESIHTTEDYMADALRYYQVGNYMQAIVIYEQLLEDNGVSEEVLCGLADNHHELGNAEKENEVRDQLFKEFPDNQDNWIASAEVKIELEQLDEAKELVEQCLSIESSNEELNKLYEQMDIQNPKVDVSQGTYDQYQRVHLTERPENATVYYSLDGKDPIAEQQIFPEEILITAPNTTLKMVAVSSLGYTSEVVSQDYTITCEVVEIPRGRDYRSSAVYDEICRELGVTSLYNYNMAQIQEFYMVGSHVSIDKAGATFSDEDYTFSYNGSSYSPSSYEGYYSTSLIQYMTNLKTLCICFQERADLSCLKDKPYLEELSLIHSHIKDVSPIAECTNLKKLSLGWNQIEDVSALSGLEQLESLGVWNNNIQDISMLGALKHLTYFDVSNNQINNIECINSMDDLYECWVNNNEISDFSPLDSCGKLGILMVSGNSGSDYGKWQQYKDQLFKTDIK